MNRTGAPADCWLLCMIHASYILNHLSCEALDGHVPLGMLYGVTPVISIILLYTFYQPVFYATQNQSYPSVSEERAERWVGFGEHIGNALTHKLIDDDTKKILYRSAVRPSDSAFLAYVFGDNKSVVTSSTVPHSLLSKRHNILSYHRVREAIAAKILVFHWCDSSQNKSDILSKHWELSKVFHII